jgi:hypothetical protein
MEVSMMKATRSATVALLVGLAASLAAPLVETEDAVLVSSSIARYVPGTVITDDQILSLPADGTAILLFRSGSILRLKGPSKASFRRRDRQPLPAVPKG